MFFRKAPHPRTTNDHGRSSDTSRARASLAALLSAMLLTCFFAAMTGCSASQTNDSPAGSSQASSESSSSISSAAPQQTPSANDPVETITVNVTVNASAVQEEGWDAYLRGINGPISLPQGSTVYDALIATGADVVMEDGYVTSIDGLRTGQFGASSGWMYSVNDANPFVPADELALNEGDSVRWYYSR